MPGKDRARDDKRSLIAVTVIGVFLCYLALPLDDRPLWHAAVYGIPGALLCWNGVRGLIRSVTRGTRPPVS